LNTRTAEIASASAAPQKIASALDDLRFEGIVETCDLASSYARSAAEAAWRGDRQLLRVHLLQASRATAEALRTFAELETGEAL
jgi:hypothetical protein